MSERIQVATDAFNRIVLSRHAREVKLDEVHRLYFAR